ncbi:helix-turn-helix transcriptional regulator [Vaginisenegalia massiliensis]|uniref:helix-turn-helix transcriptional regulator n=1 Tax=Vaginisenegalia massiliensis TaxID=2058294 RepID=UPI000F54716A|nr:helix-turn-helix transcriptional regulator [Vaginisenegalia massiliensis]
MELSQRQYTIIDIVKAHEPISGDNIAAKLGLTKSTIRSDLAVLTMSGVLDARPKVGYIYSGLDFNPLVQEHLHNVKVKEIMVAPTVIKADTTIQNAITHLFMYDVGSLYVVGGPENELVGIVSRKDLLRSIVGGADTQDTAVAIVMSRMPNIVTAYPEMTVMNAAKLITRHQIDSLPIMEKPNSKKVVGKVSKTSLVNFFVEVAEGME